MTAFDATWLTAMAAWCVFVYVAVGPRLPAQPAKKPGKPQRSLAFYVVLFGGLISLSASMVLLRARFSSGTLIGFHVVESGAGERLVLVKHIAANVARLDWLDAKTGKCLSKSGISDDKPSWIGRTGKVVWLTAGGRLLGFDAGSGVPVVSGDSLARRSALAAERFAECHLAVERVVCTTTKGHWLGIGDTLQPTELPGPIAASVQDVDGSMNPVDHTGHVRLHNGTADLYNTDEHHSEVIVTSDGFRLWSYR